MVENSEDKFFRGYILVRLSKIGVEWNLANRVMSYKPVEGKWKVTYSTPVFGPWDVIIEISFKKLEDLDEVVTKMREDEEIRGSIEETTTLVSSKPNYPAIP